MVDIGVITTYCNHKKGAEETFPFDEVTLVYKVMGKMFALVPTDREALSINLKCNPEKAVLLREEYDGIKPGFHMNKKHWNTIHFDGSVPPKLIFELIDHSYDLVVKSLKRSLRDELNLLKE